MALLAGIYYPEGYTISITDIIAIESCQRANTIPNRIEVMGTAKRIKQNLIVRQTPEELAVTACENFAVFAQDAVKKRGVFRAAISGGKTPERFFELLAESAAAVPWKNVHIFWVDERCVEPSSEQSNYNLARRTFLDKVPIPSENIHRMCGDCCNYGRAAAAYNDVLMSRFNLLPGHKPKFDLVMLGMGKDGHIGSLFPNSCALIDSRDLVTIVYGSDGKPIRITLTGSVLCAAEKIIIMVSGPEKADILREVFESPADELRYPVHILWPVMDKVFWLIDINAAKSLK